MNGPYRDPRAIAASLEQLLGGLDAPSSDAVETIFSDWASVVGPDLAAHSRPVSIDGDTLVIRAKDPVWASEFRWLEHTVIERLSEVTDDGRITKIQVRVGRGS